MYAAPHYRITWGGTSCEGAETWSSGLRMLNAPTEWEFDGEALWTIIYTWLTDASINMQSNFYLDWVKVAFVDVDGRYLDNGQANLYEQTPRAAGSGAVVHPPQVSLVCTLETGFTRGRAARGRLFLPTTPQQPAANGLLTTTQATNIATRTAQFIVDLQLEMEAETYVMSNIGSGTNRNVTGVSVGRAMDTQRRRRRQLEEDRQLVLL